MTTSEEITKARSRVTPSTPTPLLSNQPKNTHLKSLKTTLNTLNTNHNTNLNPLATSPNTETTNDNSPPNPTTPSQH